MIATAFVNCTKCGKRLIERRSDGLWIFRFGKHVEGSDDMPVEMYIFGSIRLKCLRKTCNHWNNLATFPEV
jgi:hypothetical protein